jgi:hypothetical protein
MSKCSVDSVSFGGINFVTKLKYMHGDKRIMHCAITFGDTILANPVYKSISRGADGKAMHAKN